MRVVVVLAALCLFACGGPSTESDEPDDSEASRGVIGDGYADALDRAGAIDDLAQERKDRLDDAVVDSE